MTKSIALVALLWVFGPADAAEPDDGKRESDLMALVATDPVRAGLRLQAMLEVCDMQKLADAVNVETGATLAIALQMARRPLTDTPAALALAVSYRDGFRDGFRGALGSPEISGGNKLHFCNAAAKQAGERLAN